MEPTEYTAYLQEKYGVKWVDHIGEKPIGNVIEKILEIAKNFAWIVVLVCGIFVLRDGYNILQATGFICLVVTLVQWFAWRAE